MKGLQEDIKTGNFKKAYLLYGEEAYLRQQYKEKLIKALNPDDDTMNFTRFEGKGIEVKEMIDLCETMPFFASARTILVENSGFFKNKCDELANYMKDLPGLSASDLRGRGSGQAEPYVQGGKGLRENLRVCQTG